VIWRRMAFFGDTMAHSALLGVVLAYSLDVPMMAGVFIVSFSLALLLLYLQERHSLPPDALLGILSHSTLAIGLVALAVLSSMRIDLMGVLFGDILAVSHTDLMVIYSGGAVITGLIVYFWRPLLASTIAPDLAQVELFGPRLARFIFVFLMACVVAIAIKFVGLILMTALLIIPAASARQFSRSPELMAVLACLTGALSVVGGLFGSLTFDTPSGPSIVMAAFVIFLLSHLLARYGLRRERV